MKKVKNNLQMKKVKTVPKKSTSKNDGWKKVEHGSKFHDFKKEKEFIGTYTGESKVTGKFKQTSYEFINEQDELVMVGGSFQIKEAIEKNGKGMYKIIWTGTIRLKGKKQTLNQYEIFFKG